MHPRNCLKSRGMQGQCHRERHAVPQTSSTPAPAMLSRMGHREPRTSLSLRVNTMQVWPIFYLVLCWFEIPKCHQERHKGELWGQGRGHSHQRRSRAWLNCPRQDAHSRGQSQGTPSPARAQQVSAMPKLHGATHSGHHESRVVTNTPPGSWAGAAVAGLTVLGCPWPDSGHPMRNGPLTAPAPNSCHSPSPPQHPTPAPGTAPHQPSTCSCHGCLQPQAQGA